MDGALMFIIYGDPHAGSHPILSIRTVTGHSQPHLITRADMGQADLRVLQSGWLRNSAAVPGDGNTAIPSTYSATAKVALVCYSCTLFPGATISASTSSQPWIWAWNKKQEFDVFSFDAKLDMHAHHAGKGGWGNFYVDMARSLSEDVWRPSLPPLRPGVATLGTSDSPIGASGLAAGIRARPAAYLHGFFMSTAFLLLFPLGVVAMRSGSASSFKWHWAVQAIGSLFVLAGAVSGIVASGAAHVFDSTHKWVGMLITLLLAAQGLAGWKHHVDFLRIKRRTWISRLHISLGRLGMVAGWANVLSGMVLSGAARMSLIVVTLVVLFDAFGVTIWVWLAVHRKKARPDVLQVSNPVWKNVGDRYIAIDAISEDGEGNDDVEAESSSGKENK